MPAALRPPARGFGTGCRLHCLLLVAMCVLPVAVHCTSTKGAEPPVPRHRPFPSHSPSPSASSATPPPAAAVTAASHDLAARAHRRRSAEETDRRCRDFTAGNLEEKSLSSPFFPNTYPNNTDCVRILDAGPGNVIRLEFREMFRMEPSEGCQFDFLEARDGRYRYSEALGRVCGHRPPSGVTSSGRYMYLHLHSDDTIEYEGFAAVYIVLPRPTHSTDDGRGTTGCELGVI